MGHSETMAAVRQVTGQHSVGADGSVGLTYEVPASAVAELARFFRDPDGDARTDQQVVLDAVSRGVREAVFGPITDEFLARAGLR